MLKYCPYCGAQLEDDMLFCGKCGKPYPVFSSQADNQANEPKASESIENQNTETAQKKGSVGRTIIISLLLAIMCILGWKLYESSLEKNKAEQAKNNYAEGISYYDKGQYRNALSCFENAGDSFPDIEKYTILCKGHLYKYLSESEIKTLCNNIDFLDTKVVLLSTDDIAIIFLDGYWSSKDDNYYFEIYSDKENYHSQYNLPADQPEDADYFYIKDGVYYLHTTTDKDIEIFRITILSKDRIMMYCFKDSSRVELSRQK